MAAFPDCLVAEQSCVQEQSCMVLYRLLEYCAAEEAVSPLGQDARTECLEAQNALQHYRPLQVCKCQRGSRREEHCLRVYWTVRFAGESEAYVCVCLSARRVTASRFAVLQQFLSYSLYCTTFTFLATPDERTHMTSS